MLKTLLIGILSLIGLRIFGQQAVLKSNLLNVGIGRNSVAGKDAAAAEGKEKQVLFEPTQFKSIDESIIKTEHQVVYVGKRAPAGVDIYEIPLFGGYQKNVAQLESDRAFIKNCDKNFESREKASQFFAKMGWQYLSEGSKEMSTYRFNLAYLLDEKNTDVYWGLGVIEYQKGEYEEAIKLMSRGIEQDEKFNVSLMVDLATVHLACYQKNGHPLDLEKANKFLGDAILLTPNFAHAYFQMAKTQMLQNQMPTAWENFHKGYALSPTAIDTLLLSEMLEKKTDPKGIFK